MTVAQALEVAACQGGQLGREAAAVARGVERGRSLTDTLVGRYGEAVIGYGGRAVLDAGEKAGSPAAALTLVKEDLERRHGDRSRALSTLAYPALLLAMALAVAFLVHTLVSPAIRSMYEVLSMTAPSGLDGLELACRAILWGVPATVLAVFGGLMVTSGRSRRAATTRRLALRLATGLPLVGHVLVGRAKARAFATAAMLAAAGLACDQALAFGARAAANPVVSAGLDRARRRVAKGLDLATALGVSGLDDAERDRAVLGLTMAGGSADKGLAELAEICRHEADRSLARLAAWTEPTLVVLVSATVCATALLLYRPLLGSASALATTAW